MIFIGSLTWDGDLQEYSIHRGETLIRCKCINKNDNGKNNDEQWLVFVDGNIIFTSHDEGQAITRFLKIARE